MILDFLKNKMDVRRNNIESIKMKEKILSTKSINKIIESGRWSSHGSEIKFLFGDENNYDKDDSDFSILTEYLNRSFDLVYKEISALDFPLKIKRYLTLDEDEAKAIKSSEDIIGDFGSYWTNGTGDSYEAYKKKRKEYFVILEGEVESLSDIDVFETIISRMDYIYGSQESEIQMKKNIKLKSFKYSISLNEIGSKKSILATFFSSIEHLQSSDLHENENENENSNINIIKNDDFFNDLSVSIKPSEIKETKNLSKHEKKLQEQEQYKEIINSKLIIRYEKQSKIGNKILFKKPNTILENKTLFKTPNTILVNLKKI
jgi:hypothetical protein